MKPPSVVQPWSSPCERMSLLKIVQTERALYDTLSLALEPSSILDPAVDLSLNSRKDGEYSLSKQKTDKVSHETATLKDLKQI